MARKKKQDAAADQPLPEVKAGTAFTCPESGRKWVFEMNPDERVERCEMCGMNAGHRPSAFEDKVCVACGAKEEDILVLRAQDVPADEGEAGRVDGAPEAGILLDIDVELIAPSRYQTRRKLGDITSLAESIKAHGLINPVTLRRVGDGYELIAGHRRLAAVKEVGLPMISAFEIDPDERTAAEMCVAENMQRINLSPIEEAEAVKALLDTGHTLQDAADRLGRTPRWVARRASLTSLIPAIADAIGDDDSPIASIPLAALEAIAPLPPEVQEAVCRRAHHCPATVSQVGQWIAEHMRDLDAATFAKDECRACTLRTGALPNLFDAVPPGDLGQCLQGACFDEKRNEAITLKVAAIRADNKDAVVFADDYYTREACQSLKPNYEVTTCKKSDKGAVPAFRISLDGTAKKCWVLSGTRRGGGEDGKAKQPTQEQKRMAAVCRYVGRMIDKQKPFSGLHDTVLLSLMGKVLAVTGTQYASSYANPKQWDEVFGPTSGKTYDETFEALWERSKPVLLGRLKYSTIIACADNYREALAIALYVYGVSADDLCQLAGEGR